MPGRKLLLPKIQKHFLMLFFSLVQKKVTCSLFDVLKNQTAVVVTPHILCTRACIIAFNVLLCLSPCFLGRVATYSQSLYGGYSLGFFSGGAAALGPSNLWSTSHIQKSTIETTLMGVPLNTKVSGAK